MTSSPGDSRASDRAKQPMLAALLSALLPGTGQIYVGRRSRGLTMLIIDISMLAVFLFFFHDKLAIAKAFVRPTMLAVMMIISLALLGYRLWAADDAYQIARENPESRRLIGWAAVSATVVIAAVLLVPHAVFAYYDIVQYQNITTVFGDDDDDPVAAPASSTTVPDAAGAEDDPSGTPSTTVTTTIPLETDALWEDLDRLNILLIGGDAGVGRTSIRTDSMIVVSIEPETGEAAMFQVPRNWTYAPLPEGMGIWDCDCYPGLTNELWVMGERYPEAFPGPGTPPENAVKGMISEFLGIPIHYYALVNLDGFVDLVDALGGVDMYVEEEIVDNEFPDYTDGTITTLVIDQGQQHMDGELALAYSRTRHQDSDYARMFRQRCVLEGLLEQTDPASLLLNFGKLSQVIRDTMTTDIPIDALPELVELMPKVDKDEITSIRFMPPTYHLKYRDDGEPGRIANIDLVHEHVQFIIDDPERATIELGLEDSEECPKAPDA
ncbi:MAG: LCP family protein [Actinomycetota bacterium]